MSASMERYVALPSEGRSPAHARRLVRDALVEAGLPDLLDSALLMTTELVTNAIVHSGTTAEVRVDIDAQRLKVTVVDRAPGVLPTTHAAPNDLGEGGRGLFLVDALADEWGTVHTGGRKAVWFALDRPRPEAPTRPKPPKARPATDAPVTPPRRDVAWLTTVGERLRRHLSSEQLVGELLTRLTEAVGGSAGAVWLEDGHGGTAMLASVGVPGDTLPSRGWPAEATVVPDALSTPSTGGVAAIGVGSLLVVPLAVEPPLAGILEIGAERPDAFGGEDLVLAQLCAERVAVTLQSARLREAEERRRGTLAFLAEASELLGGSLDVDLTLALVAQLCVPRLGEWCLVHRLDESARMTLAAAAHADEDSLPALRARAAGLEEAGAMAVGQRSPVMLADRAGVVVPLVARRRAVGVLSLGRPTGRLLNPEDTSIVGDLARRAALAIDNARLYAESTATVDALQRSLRPPVPPRVPGIDFGARYVAAGEDKGVGGDFYDVLSLPGRGWLLSIGDVRGKGAEAAAVTGRVREVIRALTRSGRSVPDVLDLLNATLLDEAEDARFCTVAMAELRPAGSDLKVVLWLAGHPRPAVLGSDGTVRLVGEPGTVLGVVPGGHLASPTTLSLHAGEALVFYTDGVTERRDGPRMFGEHHLVRTLRTCRGARAQHVAAKLQEAVTDFAPTGLRDDVAVLVVRRDPVPEPD